MRVTRLGHSCLLVEQDQARLLLDPGVFSPGVEQLRDLTGILITHSHADHLDLNRLRPLLEANPDAGLHVDEGSATVLGDAPHTIVRDGDELDLGVHVQVVGSRHAVIHPDLPVIPNVGYLLAGRFFTPGDALTVPEADVELLGLPTAAPWLKLSEAVDLLRAVAPARAFPVHDAVLATPQIWYGQVKALSPERTRFESVPPTGLLEL